MGGRISIWAELKIGIDLISPVVLIILVLGLLLTSVSGPFIRLVIGGSPMIELTAALIGVVLLILDGIYIIGSQSSSLELVDTNKY